VILSGFSAFSRTIAVATVLAFGTVLAQPAMARNAPESFADLVDKLLPTVVNITTTQNVPQQGPRLRDLPQLPPGSPFEELFKEFYAFWRRMEAYKQAFNQGGSMVLSPDSDFFRYFNDPTGELRK
jgi:serine protease Do